MCKEEVLTWQKKGALNEHIFRKKSRWNKKGTKYRLSIDILFYNIWLASIYKWIPNPGAGGSNPLWSTIFWIKTNE